MATSALRFVRTTTDKLTIKGGLLSENCESIVYVDENKEEQEVSVSNLLSAFKNQVIDFSIALKSRRGFRYSY